jgi:hypothetical protein
VNYEAYRKIGEAIMGYLGDKLDAQPGLLYYAEIEEALKQHGVQAEAAALVIGSLKRSDQARFAPFEAPDAHVLSEQVVKILTRVDMTWQ